MKRTVYKTSQDKTTIIVGSLWDETMAEIRTADPQTAFRATAALERAYTIDRLPVVERFPLFLTDWINTQNDSVKRIYTKMLYDMILWERVVVDDMTAERISERAFELLIGNTPTGTQMWTIELLALLSKQISWIEEQLTPVVRQMSESSNVKPAIAAVARRYLKQVSKLKINS